MHLVNFERGKRGIRTHECGGDSRGHIVSIRIGGNVANRKERSAKQAGRC